MEYLAHHGVKGQKWGVRRYQNADGSLTAAGEKRYSTVLETKTKSGETVYLADRNGREKGLAKMIGKMSPEIAKNQKNFHNIDIIANGKVIGNMQLDEIGNKTMYGNWFSIETAERGKGYAQAALDAGLDYSKKLGKTDFTLEVPGHSPDARHIYEKQGFKATKTVTTKEEDPYWSGLTEMKKKL